MNQWKSQLLKAIKYTTDIKENNRDAMYTVGYEEDEKEEQTSNRKENWHGTHGA